VEYPLTSCKSINLKYKNILLQERDFRPLSSTHVLILEIIERKKKPTRHTYPMSNQ
jgi:hypothetical protein